VLIRNSWGRDCDGISADWDCEGGDLWVDLEPLAANVYEVHVLE
jgi:hypothetical protein